MEEVEFSREQAETSFQVLVDVMEDKLATKQDLAQLEHKLTIRMGSMLAAAIAILTAIQKLL